MKRAPVRHYTLGIQPADPRRQALQDRLAETEQVLARTDTTSATLTAISAALLVAGAAGVGVTGQDATLPLAGRAGLVAALALVATALMTLLAAIRPRRAIPGRVLSGTPLYATLTREELAEHVRERSEEDHLIERIGTVSRIAAAKHRAQRLATTLLVAAVGTTLAAVTAVAITGLL